MRGAWFLLALGCAAGCRGREGGDRVDAGPAIAGSLEIGPARSPPPLRAPHPPVPALPDLPSLQAHERPAALPFGLKMSGLVPGSCRTVWNGAEEIPLSCMRSSLLFGFGLADTGAEALVAHRVLHATLSSLPSVVDHRLDGTEGSMRSQGSAPACTAFAEAAAIDHALARWTGKPQRVSTMQLWSRYHTPYEGNAVRANVQLSLGSEDDWPFAVHEAVSWLPCEAHKTSSSGCGKPVDPKHAQRVNLAPVAEVTAAVYLRAPETAELKTKIAAGQDVVITMTLPETFTPKGKAGARYVPHYTTDAGADAGHAVVLAGYATLPHSTYFLLHNSWGPGWGDGGYAWIHETTLAAWMREALLFSAEPTVRDHLHRPQRKRGETTCVGDLVPDSIRGDCAPRCADGSPRHDAVCAVAGQCPASYVNLSGMCVLGAPPGSGRDDASGIAWQCGPGGCSYTLPRAIDPSCTGGTCKASCPAPDFRIARVGTALTCIE